MVNGKQLDSPQAKKNKKENAEQHQPVEQQQLPPLQLLCTCNVPKI